MDGKLKALKVVQLKEILTKAAVSIPAKANKQDLIAKIIESPAAVDAYNAIYNPDIVPALVEEAIPEEATSDASPSTLPTEKAPTPEPTANAAAPSVDEEEEKRRKRAARFGIPVVEPKPSDETKKTARANRFGTKGAAKDATNGATNSKKRAAPAAETVDAEELERRKKRAERFGMPAA